MTGTPQKCGFPVSFPLKSPKEGHPLERRTAHIQLGVLGSHIQTWSQSPGRKPFLCAMVSSWGRLAASSLLPKSPGSVKGVTKGGGNVERMMGTCLCCSHLLVGFWFLVATRHCKMDSCPWHGEPTRSLVFGARPG